MNISQSIVSSAKDLGLTMVVVGDRVEARKAGDKVVAFHASPDRCLLLARERIEADRIKNLPMPKDGEPDLDIPKFLRRSENGVKPAVPTNGRRLEDLPMGPPMGSRPIDAPLKSIAIAPEKKVEAPKFQPVPKPAKEIKAKPEKKAKPVVNIIVPKPAADIKVTGLPESEGVQQQIKGSIIKSKYKERYKKHGYSCGDDVADELKAYITVMKDSRPVVDLKRLQEVAETNSVWKPTYANLNNGQMRMTIGNRLRAKFKDGADLDIGGAILRPEIAD